MKKFVAFTISLCAAIGAYLCIGGVASADVVSNQPFYPESFPSYELEDYAVNGNTYAFCANEKIAVVAGAKTEYYEATSTVTALDCADGIFYYTDGSTVYSLPNQEVSEHTFNKNKLDNDDNAYAIDEGNIVILNLTTGKSSTIEGEYSNIKIFDGVAYALDGNSLCRVTPPSYAGTTASAQSIYPFNGFIDYSILNTIPVGNTKSLIEASGEDELKFVTLKAGTEEKPVYISEIDYDNIPTASGGYFNVGKTYVVGKDIAKDKSALLLCTCGESGSVSIVVTDNKCYILRTENTLSKVSQSLTEMTATAVVATPDHAYSVPFVKNGAVKFDINLEDVVTILGEVSIAETTGSFYKIEKDGEIGYVLKQHVIVINGNGEGDISHRDETKEPSRTSDENYSEEDMVKTVVLVLVVVVLIIIAGSYLIYVGSTGKKKKEKGEKTD